MLMQEAHAKCGISLLAARLLCRLNLTGLLAHRCNKTHESFSTTCVQLLESKDGRAGPQGHENVPQIASPMPALGTWSCGSLQRDASRPIATSP